MAEGVCPGVPWGMGLRASCWAECRLVGETVALFDLMGRGEGEGEERSFLKRQAVVGYGRNTEWVCGLGVLEKL